MTISRNFFRFAAICTLITAFTTIVVHAVPNLFTEYDTFEKRIDLRNHWIYITRFWIVLLHCVCVVVSMYAVGIRRIREAPVLVPLGFLSFVLFAFTEWLRTTLAIFGLNRTWRNAYALSGQADVKAFTENYINAFSGFNDAFFFIFFTCFLAGCALYGFAYKNGEESDRKIGWLFLAWTLTGVPAWLDEVFLTQWSAVTNWMGWYFQCIARAILAVWLWKKSAQLTI